jgi:hypothetical protein
MAEFVPKRSRRTFNAADALRAVLESEDNEFDDGDEEYDESDKEEEDFVITDEDTEEDEGGYNEEEELNVTKDALNEKSADVGLSFRGAQGIFDAGSENEYVSKDGLRWSHFPLQNNPRGRQQGHNIVRQCAGPVRQAVDLASTREGALKCFITQDIIDLIVKHTNEEGVRVFGEDWTNTTAFEIQTYLGLLLLAGVYRGRQEPIIHLWSREQGRPLFSAAMSRNRFQTITRVMRFDSKDTRTERRARDKMAPIRDIHDKFAARCRIAYKPGTQLCVDEQLVVYRGRCPFKVYIPSKPGKYGMKVWICCDVDTSYVCNLELYAGRQGRSPETDQATRVVLQMTSPFNGSGRGCTGDNFFTSRNLVDSSDDLLWHCSQKSPLSAASYSECQRQSHQLQQICFPRQQDSRFICAQTR